MPDSVLLCLAVGPLALWVVAETHRIKSQHPRRLTGWWHYQSSGPGFRWQPSAWKSACDLSLERSRERRGS